MGMPTDEGGQGGETEHVTDGHVPAASEPSADRARLWEEVRQGDASGGTEPEHGAAVADREGEHAPVVTSLLERQRGQRDVVEDR